MQRAIVYVPGGDFYAIEIDKNNWDGFLDELRTELIAEVRKKPERAERFQWPKIKLVLKSSFISKNAIHDIRLGTYIHGKASWILIHAQANASAVRGIEDDVAGALQQECATTLAHEWWHARVRLLGDPFFRFIDAARNAISGLFRVSCAGFLLFGIPFVLLAFFGAPPALVAPLWAIVKAILALMAFSLFSSFILSSFTDEDDAERYAQEELRGPRWEQWLSVFVVTKL